MINYYYSINRLIVAALQWIILNWWIHQSCRNHNWIETIDKSPSMLQIWINGDLIKMKWIKYVLSQSTYVCLQFSSVAWLTLLRKCFLKIVAVVLHSSLVRVVGDRGCSCSGSTVSISSWLVPSIQYPPNWGSRMRGKGLFLPNTCNKIQKTHNRLMHRMIWIGKSYQDMNTTGMFAGHRWKTLPHGHLGREYSLPPSAKNRWEKRALSVCSSSRKKIATESNSIIPQDAVSQSLRNTYAMEISF